MSVDRNTADLVVVVAVAVPEAVDTAALDSDWQKQVLDEKSCLLPPTIQNELVEAMVAVTPDASEEMERGQRQRCLGLQYRG